eukprot:gene18624-830_t
MGKGRRPGTPTAAPGPLYGLELGTAPDGVSLVGCRQGSAAGDSAGVRGCVGRVLRQVRRTQAAAREELRPTPVFGVPSAAGIARVEGAVARRGAAGRAAAEGVKVRAEAAGLVAELTNTFALGKRARRAGPHVEKGGEKQQEPGQGDTDVNLSRLQVDSWLEWGVR